jgi:hypothetical protein
MNSKPHPYPRIRLRTAPLAVTVMAFAALATLAACSSGGGTGPAPAGTAGRCTADSTATCQPPSVPPAPTVTAPITPAQAQAVVTRYVKINNAANAVAYSNPARAKSLNAQIETDALRAQSLAQFTKLKIATAKDRADYAKPFYYSHSTFYIPSNRLPGQRPFFVAITHDPEDFKQARLLVFVQSANTTWLNAAAVDQQGPVPAIALDKLGYATAVDPDAAGLAMKPSLLAAAVNDNYAGAGKGDGAALSPTKIATDQRGAQKTWEKTLLPYARANALPANDPYRDVWAIRTKTGGALVVSSRLFDRNEFAVMPAAYLTIPAHDDARAWVGARSTNLSMTYTCLDAAVVPKQGKTSQFGEDCEIVKATG